MKDIILKVLVDEIGYRLSNERLAQRIADALEAANIGPLTDIGTPGEREESTD